MKAAVFKALGEPLVIEERPEPIPNRTDVLVKVGRCGICGSDLHMTEDAFFRVPANTMLGHEYCGEVYAVGEDVQSIKVGDRIAVFPVRSCGHCVSCMEGNPVWCARMQLEGGGYAQYSLADERQCGRSARSVYRPRDFEIAADLFDAGVVEPRSMITDRVSLAALPAAFEALRHRSHQCKVMVDPWAIV